MSVTIRPYRGGGWEVDIRVVSPDGTRHKRERKHAPISSRSAVGRWAAARERVLFERLLSPPKDHPRKEVPTLQEFAPRFVDGHARANRQKPSGIASKTMILRLYLIPAFGRRHLDAIKSEDVQRLKAQLEIKSPKTVNNILAVLSILLKKAVEWDVIERMPCRIKLLPIEKGAAAFHDFEEYERLVDVARAIDQRTYLIVLLGGEAGLRCGEMIALEWGDVDLAKRQLCVRRSDWNGQVGTPKGGRQRYVPLTRRLDRGARRASAPEEQAGVLPGRSHAVHAADRAEPDATGGAAGERQARGAHPASHVLLAPLDARGAAEGDPGARRACGSDDDPALHAPQSGSPRRGDRPAGTAVRRYKVVEICWQRGVRCKNDQ